MFRLTDRRPRFVRREAQSGLKRLRDEMRGGELPRLIYIGDVQVEETFAGMLFLHRLLRNYPRDRLLIVEGLERSDPGLRLLGVQYKRLWAPLRRGLWTRYGDWFAAAHTLLASVLLQPVPGYIREFQPEAVLTIPWQYSWLVAAAHARRAGLPLHLICHDDWPRRVSRNPTVLRMVDGHFAAVYRQAASRLCVSPLMAATFEQRYGARGTVLYPVRSSCEASTDPVPRLLEQAACPTAAYVGSIQGAGTVDALRLLALVLAERGGRVIVFGPDPPGYLRQLGLDLTNVEIRGFVERGTLKAEVRSVADFLVVTSSFREEDKVSLSFPSKLTDYTVLGLPILVRGPAGGVLARWARAHPGVGEIVDQDGIEPLRDAVARLAGDPNHRWQLARNAAAIGERCFAHRVGEGVFLDALRGASTMAAGGEIAGVAAARYSAVGRRRG
jgi:glycosyltransferase involved in cell wall biosynthesis